MLPNRIINRIIRLEMAAAVGAPANTTEPVIKPALEMYEVEDLESRAKATAGSLETAIEQARWLVKQRIAATHPVMVIAITDATRNKRIAELHAELVDDKIKYRVDHAVDPQGHQ